MSSAQRRYPSYLAPIISAVVVMYFTAMALFKEKDVAFDYWIVIGAGVGGFLLGCVIWLLDYRSDEVGRASMLRKIICLLALVASIIPFVNLPFALLALFLIRGYGGFFKWVAFTAVMLSLAVSGLLMYMYATGKLQ